ncbi:MAG: integrase [Rhizobiales bacterium]|nr:integrase [Hyphomicrobiales bacterium]
MESFFGGRPLMVLLKLVVISIIVGIVLAALNLDAVAIIRGIRDLAERIYAMGFDAVEWVLQYFLLGAIIVFPIWLIARLLRIGSGGSRNG